MVCFPSIAPAVPRVLACPGPFCWILLEKDSGTHSGRDVGYAMRASLMHGQVWMIYVLNSLFYVRIYKFIKAITAECRKGSEASAENVDGSMSSKRSESKDSSVEKTVKILQYYPVILIVTWGPLIVMRVFEYMSFTIPCWLLALSLGMTNLTGLGNAIVFFSVSAVCGFISFLLTEIL